LWRTSTARRIPTPRTRSGEERNAGEGEVQEVEKTKGLQKRPQQKKGEEKEERAQALRNATVGTMGMVSVAL
jgi:hypothetical protein